MTAGGWGGVWGVCVWVGVQGDLLWGVCCVKCVYFDIKAGGKDVGRITPQLKADVVPMTADRGVGVGRCVWGCDVWSVDILKSRLVIKM